MKITFCFIFADGARTAPQTKRWPTANFFYTFADAWVMESGLYDSNPAIDYEILAVA